MGSTSASKDKYEDLAEDGYIKNAIAFRCVNEIANGAGAIKFKLLSGEDIIDEHPILTLLESPNPVSSGTEYFNALYSYLLLCGNSYMIRSGPEFGEPQELHLLRPDRMRIKGGARSIPEAYEYVLNGRVVERYPVDQDTGRGESVSYTHLRAHET